MSDSNNNDDFLNDDFLDDEGLDNIDLELDDSLVDDTHFDAMDSNMDGELDEDDWDSFDDSDDAVGTSREQSFLSRYFNAILITVVTIGGGIFLYSKFLAPAQNTPPPVQSVQQSNITASPEGVETKKEMAVTGLGLDLQNLRSSNERTPIALPYLDDIEAIDNENALEADSVQEKTTADYAAVPIADEDDFFSDINLANKPEASDEDDPEDMQAFKKVAPVPVQTTVELTPMPQIITPEPEKPVVANASVRVIEEELISIAKPQAPEFAAIEEPVIATVDADVAIGLQEDVSALTSELESLTGENAELKAELSTSSRETESLEKMVDDLKAKIARLEKEAFTPSKAVTITPSAPKVAATNVAPKTIAEPNQEAASTVKAAPKVVQVKAAPVWVMKSAQDGRAVLADKKTGDSVRVTVGESVAGLGTIQSITFNNGVWIVKGTLGSVTR